MSHQSGSTWGPSQVAQTWWWLHESGLGITLCVICPGFGDEPLVNVSVWEILKPVDEARVGVTCLFAAVASTCVLRLCYT